MFLRLAFSSLALSCCVLPACSDGTAFSSQAAAGAAGTASSNEGGSGGSSAQAGSSDAGGSADAGAGGDTGAGGVAGAVSSGGTSSAGQGGTPNGGKGGAPGAGMGGATSAGAGGIATSIGAGGDGQAGQPSMGGASSGGANTAACPSDLAGLYTVTDMGMGCGDLSVASPVCISAGGDACTYQLKSGQQGLLPAVNGPIKLGPKGDFTMAALKLGGTQRGGCYGQWDDASKTLTAICGGTDPTVSQYCAATLTQAATSCP